MYEPKHIQKCSLIYKILLKFTVQLSQSFFFFYWFFYCLQSPQSTFWFFYCALALQSSVKKNLYW